MTTVVDVRRVLLADDVAQLRMLLRMALELNGAFEVVAEAADGAEAIVRAAECQPDLVILDLMMPGLDGLEALPGIREAAPGAKVVVLSGFAEEKLRSRALAAGATEYLEKGDVFGVVETLERLSAAG